MTFKEIMARDGVTKLEGYTSYNTWQCTRKLAFPSEKAALIHTRRLKPKFRVYRCHLCEQYHLTSQKEDQ